MLLEQMHGLPRMMMAGMSPMASCATGFSVRAPALAWHSTQHTAHGTRHKPLSPEVVSCGVSVTWRQCATKSSPAITEALKIQRTVSLAGMSTGIHGVSVCGQALAVLSLFDLAPASASALGSVSSVWPSAVPPPPPPHRDIAITVVVQELN